jgi:hypothetical protein
MESAFVIRCRARTFCPDACVLGELKTSPLNAATDIQDRGTFKQMPVLSVAPAGLDHGALTNADLQVMMVRQRGHVNNIGPVSADYTYRRRI